MLTEEGYKARFWSRMGALRHLLGEKEIPDHYYGPTSASDNMFDAVRRHLRLATLLREYGEELVQAAASEAPLAVALLAELEDVRGIFLGASGQFAQAAEQVEQLRRRVYEARRNG